LGWLAKEGEEEEEEEEEEQSYIPKSIIRWVIHPSHPIKFLFFILFYSWCIHYSLFMIHYSFVLFLLIDLLRKGKGK